MSTAIKALNHFTHCILRCQVHRPQTISIYDAGIYKYYTVSCQTKQVPSIISPEEEEATVLSSFPFIKAALLRFSTYMNECDSGGTVEPRWLHRGYTCLPPTPRTRARRKHGHTHQEEACRSMDAGCNTVNIRSRDVATSAN